jgi:hypothetical protein
MSDHERAGLIPESGGIEWDSPPCAEQKEVGAGGEPMGKEIKAVAVGGTNAGVVGKTFKGSAHRALPEFGLISPGDLADSGGGIFPGKWRQVEDRI